MKKVFIPLWIFAIVFVSGVVAARQEIIFATTTSVQDAGLLDVIIPIFEKERGYRVKPIAVGTSVAAPCYRVVRSPDACQTACRTADGDRRLRR